MSNASKFIMMLMNSRNQAHVFHLSTTSYAQHKALESYYEGIVPLLDAYAEAYMGAYGRIKLSDLNKRYMTDPKNARLYFQALIARIKALKLPKDTFLTNIQDEIIALIRTTMYKFTLK